MGTGENQRRERENLWKLQQETEAKWAPEEKASCGEKFILTML